MNHFLVFVCGVRFDIATSVQVNGGPPGHRTNLPTLQPCRAQPTRRSSRLSAESHRDALLSRQERPGLDLTIEKAEITDALRIQALHSTSPPSPGRKSPRDEHDETQPDKLPKQVKVTDTHQRQIGFTVKQSNALAATTPATYPAPTHPAVTSPPAPDESCHGARSKRSHRPFGKPTAISAANPGGLWVDVDCPDGVKSECPTIEYPEISEGESSWADESMRDSMRVDTPLSPPKSIGRAGARGNCRKFRHEGQVFTRSISKGQFDRLQNIQSRVANVFEHPHLVKVIKVGPVPTDTPSNVPRYILQTDFAPFGNLENKLSSSRQQKSKGRRCKSTFRNVMFDEDEARDIFKPLAEAVKHFHDHKIAHRNICPKNIVFDAPAVKVSGQSVMSNVAEVPKLAHFHDVIDFSELASASDEEQRLLRRQEMIAKSSSDIAIDICDRGYRAPEVLEQACAQWDKADVFSLGAMLYRAVTGEMPSFDEECGEFDINVPATDCLSETLTSLLTDLLDADPDYRISIDNFLDSPWMQGFLDHDEYRTHFLLDCTKLQLAHLAASVFDGERLSDQYVFHRLEQGADADVFAVLDKEVQQNANSDISINFTPFQMAEFLATAKIAPLQFSQEQFVWVLVHPPHLRQTVVYKNGLKKILDGHYEIVSLDGVSDVRQIHAQCAAADKFMKFVLKQKANKQHNDKKAKAKEKEQQHEQKQKNNNEDGAAEVPTVNLMDADDTDIAPVFSATKIILRRLEPIAAIKNPLKHKYPNPEDPSKPIMRTSVDASRRFEREAEIFEKLWQNPHPNVIQGTRVVLPHKFFFLCEYAHAGDLINVLTAANVLYTGPLAATKKNVPRQKYILKLFAGVMQGLKHLHSNGVVHMDIKPDNILIFDNQSPECTVAPGGAPEYVAKLADFGHSKLLEHNSQMVETYYGDAGTFNFVAPEIPRFQKKLQLEYFLTY